MGADGRFKAPDGVNPSTLPPQQRLPYVDAWNFTIQRELSSEVSAEIAYVGNKGTHVFNGDGPDINFNQPTIVGFAQGVPTSARRPFNLGTAYGAPFGLTTDIRYLCNCSDNNYEALQAKLTKRYSGGYSLLATYTLQRIRNHGTDQYFYDRSLEYGSPQWARTHGVTLAATVELPFGKGKKYGGDASTGLDALIGGWQFNTNAFIYSGQHLNVDYRDSGQDRDTGPNRPNVIGDITAGGGSQGHVVQRHAHRHCGQRLQPAREGHLRRHGARDAHRTRLLERGRVLVQAVQVLEPCESGAPRSRRSTCSTTSPSATPTPRSACPATTTPTRAASPRPAPNWQARNLQFGLRFQF